MKRKNPFTQSLYLLVASAALILLSIFVIKPQFQKEKDQKEKSDLLWKDAKREKILEISVTPEEVGKVYSLKRSAESKDWIIDGANTFDADNSTVDSLISSLLGTKKEASLPIEIGKAGLDVPKSVVKIVYTDEKEKRVEQTLLIGEDSPVDYQSYARWKDSNDVFMISKSLKFATDKKANDFRNKKVFNYKLADLKSINMAGTKNYKLELADGGKWWLNLNDRKLATDAAVVSNWIISLSNTRAAGFPAEDKKELSKYALDKAAFSIEIENLKGEKTKWQIGHLKSKTENHAYLTNNKIESIYEIPVSFVDEIGKDPSEFRNKKVSSFDVSKASKVLYTSKDYQIELVKNGNEWTGTHTFKGKKVDGKAKKALLEKMLNSLSVTRAVSFVEKNPKTPSLGLDGKRKVEVFENPTGTPTVSYLIGNKLTATDTVIWTPQFEDPILSLFDYDELFPQDASKIIEIPAEPTKSADNNLAKDTSNRASSATGKTKIMKLEKTVTSPKDLKKLPAPLVEKGAKYTAQIIFKNGRKLKVELAADKAPYTVSNFIHLARNGFFDGVVFHRVIKDFVAQGGDPTGSGRGGPGWMFDNEDNDLKHVKGSLSMAHAGRNTNGSQFFIVLAPQPHLDGLHTVYGQVTDGINEIDQIKQGDAMQTVEIYEEK